VRSCTFRAVTRGGDTLCGLLVTHRFIQELPEHNPLFIVCLNVSRHLAEAFHVGYEAHEKTELFCEIILYEFVWKRRGFIKNSKKGHL